MLDVLEIVSVYLLAMIGLFAVVVVAVGLWLAYKCDVTFTIKSGNHENKDREG